MQEEDLDERADRDGRAPLFPPSGIARVFTMGSNPSEEVIGESDAPQRNETDDDAHAQINRSAEDDAGDCDHEKTESPGDINDVHPLGDQRNHVPQEYVAEDEEGELLGERQHGVVVRNHSIYSRVIMVYFTSQSPRSIKSL